jgi:carbamoyltransferase
VKVLGVGGLNHDPAVAILQDGVISLAIESEKITRHKREVSFCPIEAIEAGLEYTSLSLRDIDFIVTNWDGRPTSNRCYVQHIAKYLRYGLSPVSHVATLMAIAGSHTRNAFFRLKEDQLPPIRPVAHHLAHLGSTYTLSDFEESAVAIIDGAGELGCTSLYLCRGRAVEHISSMDLPLNSLGHLYTMATRQLGFGILGDEFKVMGLAGYGKPDPRFRSFFERAIHLLPNGRYSLDAKIMGHSVNNGFAFPPHVSCELPPPPSDPCGFNQEHFDFAFELQRRLEEALVHVLRQLRHTSGMKQLCLAGGVALNSVANARIAGETGFESIFIQPASNDGGTPLGAAAYFSYHVLGEPRPHAFRSAFLGPSYSDDQVRRELERSGVQFKVIEDPSKEAASLLSKGEIIGWFQGRTEFGPRALGNRSILADPTKPENREAVNKLKGREWFRPLAPAVLIEQADTYFEANHASPFMLYVSKVKEELAPLLPAVTHVDGTARLQTVERQDNPRFYELIQEFGRLRGIPVVLNTSFNLAGEPLVNSPRDALRTFFTSGLHALIIGRYLVRKTES